MLDAITNYIIHLISVAGYTGVVFLNAVSSAAIPLPSEIVMTFSGFLVSQGRFTLPGIVFAGTLGSTIGSLLLYYMGYYGGRPLVERYGKYVLVSHRDLEMTENFFNKYGDVSNFIGRLLPIVRTFISFPAGIARMEIKRFLFYTVLGSLIWAWFLGWLGTKLGEHWKQIKDYAHNFELLIVLLIAIGIALYIYRHLRR